MKYLCTFLLFMAFFSGAIGQKPLRALKQVYSKKELNEFKQIHGSLDLLYFAYDHAITIIQNNGGKGIDTYPKAKKTTYFTELNVKIQPYTQYFTTEVNGELLAVKSLYQLQLAFKESNPK